MKQLKLIIGSLAMVIAMSLGFTAKAADAPLPSITMYYPGENVESPTTLDPGTSAYVYFATGSQVAYVKALIVQNETQLGTCVYRSKTGEYSNIVMLNWDLPENADLANLATGKYTLKFYEAKYKVSGSEYTYSDTANPFASVTYYRSLPEISLVSETGLADDCFMSYFPLDGDEGVKTYTFSSPLKAEGISAYLEYGMMDQYFIIPVDHTLSADGLTLAIDFRGPRRGVDDMAPGYTFVDEMGKPLPPPTDISLNVSGLVGIDGANVITVARSLDGTHSTKLKGAIYKSFNYFDLSFATPILVRVDFYDSANPSVRFAAINNSTNTMDLTVLGAEFIRSADMLLKVDAVSARIPNADIKKAAQVYTVTLPAAIKEAGSEGLVVYLDNVTYTYDDGGQHEIKPYGTASAMTEVLTIADLKRLTANQDVVLNSVDGVKVTLSNDLGYTFIEDATGGLMISTSDYSKVIDEGQLLKGRLVGKYMGYGLFMIDKAASSYAESDIDVSVGTMIDDLSLLSTGVYDNCLITMVNSAATPMEVVAGNQIVIGGKLAVITDFIPDFEAPEEVVNLTGIYYNDPSLGQAYLLIRRIADINRNMGPEVTVCETLAEVKAAEPGVELVYKAVDAKVTFADIWAGTAIIEDASAAMMVYLDESLLLMSGDCINGDFTCVYYGESIMDMAPIEYDITVADVTTGAEMAPKDVFEADNVYRLVTFNNTKDCPLTVDGWAINIADVVYAVDYFAVLDYDYEFPSGINSVTGIIVPNMMMSVDGEAEISNAVFIAVRDSSDVVAKEDGIISVTNDTKADFDVYDIRGVKVRGAGESFDGVIPGVYIINGKKTIIRK